jgi:UPF0176 protein
MNSAPDTLHSSKSVCVAALYRFVRLADYAALQPRVLEQLKEQRLRGTLLLANEGINGTVAGAEINIDAFVMWLKHSDVLAGRLSGLEVKKSFSESMPFARSKVKLKKEIVTMGVTDIDPNGSVGTYVAPQDWNALIDDPDVLTIDTRNEYEVQIGRFKGAVNPHTASFREFPEYANRELDPAKHTKVAMYCTGGIRCEKSTAYLKKLGFEEVYHLQGGILKYLEEVKPEDSLWQGECFVFDERVAVDHDLAPGSYTQCHACRMPLAAAELDSDEYIPGESCPHCFGRTSEAQRARFREREKQVRLAAARGESHIGENMDEMRQQRHASKLEYKRQQRARS